jgi:hypothetical protein
VHIVRGPLAGQLRLYAGMRPRDRIGVLLAFLGAHQHVTLPAAHVERA